MIYVTVPAVLLLISISGVAHSTGPGPVTLLGAGATFPQNVYMVWMAAYQSKRSQFASVQMRYDGRGSGYGKQAIKSQLQGIHVEYAGSDAPLLESDYLNFTDLVNFPSLAG